MTRRPDIEHDILDLTAAFLALRRFGLECTTTIEREVGADYQSNATIACLAAICERGPIRLRDLADVVALSGPTASRVVDRLAELGDVVRRSDGVDTDKRAVTTEPTCAGQRHLAAIDRSLVADADKIGAPVKEAIARLEQLSPSSAAEAPPSTFDSLAGHLARFGMILGDSLRSMSASGDLTEAMALFAMAETGESRPRTIADRVGLTSGGTTKLLDRLERQGYVERTFGLAHDRRGVALRLTPAGHRQLADMSALAAGFVPEAHRALVELADRLDVPR